MEIKKVFALLSLNRMLNYSVSCGNCKANVFVNPFAFPFIVNIISSDSISVLTKQLQEKASDTAFQLKGEWTMDDFIKAVNIPTLSLQTAPDIIQNQSPEIKVDAPSEVLPSKEGQLEAMAKYLSENGYEVQLKNNPLP